MKNKIANAAAGFAIGYVVLKAVDTVAPRKSQDWPSITRIALLAVAAVGIAYTDVVLERKLGIEDD